MVKPRQGKPEYGTISRYRLDLDLTTVALYDLFTDRQTNTRPLITCHRVKTLKHDKHLLVILRVDTYAIVLNGNTNLIVPRRAAADGDPG